MRIEGEKRRVFISYRRGGGAEIARLIEAFLDAQGLDVFLDVDSLGGGHFDEQILREIEARDVFILICSPGCFDRCVDRDDWVRRELEHAISLEKRIVPVVTWGFNWPRPEELPESIRAVTRHNAFEYSHTHWKRTRGKLLDLIVADARRTTEASPADESIPRSKGDRGASGAGRDTGPGTASGLGQVLDPLSTATDSPSPSDLARLMSFAEQGNTDAQHALGAAYETGRGVERSDKQAVVWYRKAAEQGSADAQYRLGWMHAAGRGVDKSDEQALVWLRKAAEQGLALACYSLGGVYANGQGVVRSYEHAAAWYLKAAEQGLAEAQFNLGGMYEVGRGVEQCDGQAVVWYRKAAEQGHAGAQVNLGVKYLKGQGVEQSDTQAVAWFRKAAKQGEALAQFNLALMYEKGRGVEPSSKQAAAWYREAAERGNVGAQCNLAELYEKGHGIEQSDKQAVFWYRKAAEQEDAFAQAMLARMLDEGRGID